MSVGDGDSGNEPLFKYARYTGSDLHHLLQQPDSNPASRITCIAVGRSSSNIYVATANGVLHLFNEATGAESVQLPLHSTAIRHLAVDINGTHIATADDNGIVCITNLSSTEVIKASYKRPITALTLPQPLAYSTTQAYVVASASQLIYNTRGWSGVRDNVIHSNEGEITAVAMRQDLLAWANAAGVKLYDTANQQRVSYIAKPASVDLVTDGCKPHLHWINDTTLIVGWGYSIRVAVVKRRKVQTAEVGSPGPQHRRPHSVMGSSSPMIMTSGSKYQRYVQIISMFDVSYIICGVASLGNEHIVVLGLPSYTDTVDDLPSETVVDDSSSDISEIAPGHGNADSVTSAESDDQTTDCQPELRVLTMKGEDVYSEALATQQPAGSSALKPIDLTLQQATDDTADATASYKSHKYLITTPYDIIAAHTYTAEDLIQYLLSTQQFERAIQATEQYTDVSSTSQRALRADIANRYMNYLFDKGQYEQAATLAPTLFANNESLWLDWISKFRNRQQLQLISPYIPTSVDCMLPSEVYESVLFYFMIADPEHMLLLLREWSSQCFDVSNVIAAVDAQIQHMTSQSQQPTPTWLDILAELYLLNRQWSDAINMMLRTGRRHDLFEVIVEHDLFHLVADRVKELCDFDADRAIQMLSQHVDHIPADSVLQQLEGDEQLTYKYLQALFNRDSHAATQYHNQQLELCAKLDPTSLLHFLQKSYNYNTERALQITVEHKMYPEMVYVLRRMNRMQEALHTLIDQLGDVQQAIELVEAADDSRLWDQLIAGSLKQPALLAELLQHITTHATISTDSNIQLQKLIQAIPDELPIPGLRAKLLQLLTASKQQLALTDTSTVTKELELTAQVERRYRRAKRAVVQIDLQTTCQLCSHLIVNERQTVRVFGCQHVCHESCLPATRQRGQVLCPVCAKDTVKMEGDSELLLAPLSPMQAIPSDKPRSNDAPDAKLPQAAPTAPTSDVTDNAATARTQQRYRSLADQMKAAQSVMATSDLTLWSDSQFF